jgi:gliding motility-associated-like protein
MKISTSNSPDITKWKWYPAKDLSCADCPQPVVTAKENTVYKAEAKNEGGCAATDEVTVSVICNDGNVFIPNTFSPNNDGMNEVFYPRGKGITSIKNMKIFNRWGELVYEKSNFSANDAAAGWNGSYKGSILTPDVYVYIVDVVCYNSTVFTLKGNVTLIR